MISAVIMMSVTSNETTTASTTTVDSNTSAASNTSTEFMNMNQCGPATLGANMPKSAADCQTSTAPVNTTCCYASLHVSAAVTNLTAFDASLCLPVPSGFSSTAASELISATYAQMGIGITLNNLSCASSFIQTSALLIALMTLIL